MFQRILFSLAILPVMQVSAFASEVTIKKGDTLSGLSTKWFGPAPALAHCSYQSFDDFASLNNDQSRFAKQVMLTGYKIQPELKILINIKKKPAKQKI